MLPGVNYPYWLLAPLLLVMLFALTPRSLQLPGEWSSAVNASLRGFLSNGVNSLDLRERLSPLLLLWILLAAALASISLGHTDSPSLRNLHARVVIIDLGVPNEAKRQVVRARQLLANSRSVPTAVVAVSSHAFVVVPFTTDHRHVDRYLEVLDPDVMPVAGRAPALGLDRAAQLLKQNEILESQVIVFSDSKPPVEFVDPDSFGTEDEGIGSLDEVPIWFVVDEQQQPAWREYAGRLNARITDPSNTEAVHRDLESRRQRAVTNNASIRQRRDLTPWLVVCCLLLWLHLFVRREKS